MDIFQKLSMAKRSAMELLFQNCTEKVKNYMFTMEVAAGQTFIQAGEPCRNAAVPGQRGRADNYLQPETDPQPDGNRTVYRRQIVRRA